jgi:SNF2 family DNA or RNA helicase
MMPGILDWLRRNLFPGKILDLPLEFHLDVDEQGRYHVRISYTIDEEITWIDDVTKLWKYGGFRVERPGEKYIVSPEDLDILLALHSVRPDTEPDGELVLDFYPPVLRHLRQKRTVIESKASQEYKILEEPLQIGAKLDFDPSTGLTVETGYRIPNTSELIPESELEVSADGRYARIGKRFVPLPKQISNKERSWLKKVRQVVSPDQIPEFFKRDMVLFETGFQAILTEAASKLKVIELSDSPRVRVKSNEQGWLEFQLDYVVESHNIPFDKIWQSKGKSVQCDPYTFVTVPTDQSKRVLKELTALSVQETATGYRVPIAQFISLEDFIEHIGGQREVDVAYEQFLDELEGFEADEGFRLPKSVEQDLDEAGIKLRHYQRAGVHWLTWLAKHHLHGLLADDMGLGKTIQTAVALRLITERSEARLHSLVVCPKSVIRHWSRELRRCYPQLRIEEYIGINRNQVLWQRFYAGAVVISTYATVARDIDIISKVPLLFLILDESTKIKNPQTQRARAIKTLNAAHRIALSGTPVENRPAELWSVFDFLMRGHLGTYGAFQRTFETPIMVGDQEIAECLGKRVGPFLLRRRKEEVAKELPEKIEMEEWVELTEEQRKLYVAIQNREAEPIRQSLQRGDRVNYPNILATLTKLKQVCNHPALITGEQHPIEGRSEKFDAILNQVQDIIIDHDEKVVLFSQYLDMLDIFETALRRYDMHWVRLDGSVSMRSRQERIDRFNDHEAQVALCSLQAVGHGVNLTAANHVIHIDRWWNPATEDQATDRLHRIGQKKTVFVHYVQTRDTLEEKIEALQDRKRGLSDRIMSAATRGQQRWTREELIELLRPLD